MEKKHEETVEKEIDEMDENTWHYAASLISIIFFLVSFDADIILACEYHRRHMYHAFNATAAVLVASGIVIGCLSSVWSILNEGWTKYRPLYFVCLLARFPFAGLARDIDIVSRWFGRRAHTDQQTFEQVYSDARKIRLYDVLIGSTPQFILQTSYYIVHRFETDLYLAFLRRVSAMSSFGVIMWSLIIYIFSSYQKPDSTKANEGKKSSVTGIILDFFARKTAVAVFVSSHVAFALSYYFFSLISTNV